MMELADSERTAKGTLDWPHAPPQRCPEKREVLPLRRFRDRCTVLPGKFRQRGARFFPMADFLTIEKIAFEAWVKRGGGPAAADRDSDNGGDDA